MKSIFKKIFMLLLVLCVFTAVSCSDEKTPEEVNITITASKTTVQKGDTIDFAVEVTGKSMKIFLNILFIFFLSFFSKPSKYK